MRKRGGTGDNLFRRVCFWDDDRIGGLFQRLRTIIDLLRDIRPHGITVGKDRVGPTHPAMVTVLHASIENRVQIYSKRIFAGFQRRTDATYQSVYTTNQTTYLLSLSLP